MQYASQAPCITRSRSMHYADPAPLVLLIHVHAILLIQVKPICWPWSLRPACAWNDSCCFLDTGSAAPCARHLPVQVSVHAWLSLNAQVSVAHCKIPSRTSIPGLSTFLWKPLWTNSPNILESAGGLRPHFSGLESAGTWRVW